MTQSIKRYVIFMCVKLLLQEKCCPMKGVLKFILFYIVQGTCEAVHGLVSFDNLAQKSLKLFRLLKLFFKYNVSLMPFSSQSKLCFCSGSNSKSLSAGELFLLIPKGLAKPRYRITNFNHLLHHLITELGKVCESGKPSGLAGWLLKRKIEKTSRVKRGADCPRLFSKLFAEQILPFECL